MSNELPRIEIHTSADKYVKPGEAHLLIANKDWQSVHEFFAKHFELWEPIRTEDGYPTGYIRKLSDNKTTCTHNRIETTCLYWNGVGPNPNKRFCHDCGKVWEPGE